MRLPRFRLARLSTYVVAGAIALSALVGPALVPGEIGGRVAHALEADIDLFRQELSPYGEWFEHDRYGEVWRPTHVRRDWRPYYDDGHWAYSDEYGWMWISDEPWGWAPFHYGRWAFTRDDGWIWVPGRQWGPAWVTFRSGQDSIGWAPLPPEADWDPGFGFLDDDDDYYDSDYYDNYYGYDRYYGDNDFGLAEMIWAFVRPEGFLEPDFHRYAYDRRDYPRIIHRTRDITNITVINNRVVNRSIEINNIEHVTRKKVRRVRVEEADRPDRIRRRGENIVLYKPVVVEKEEKRWRSRGDGLKAEERTAKRKKRGSDDADTARQQQLEPSTGADVATETPLRKKKKRSDSAAQQQVEPATNADVATEQPLRKKKRKAQTLEQQIEPSAGVTDDVEQPVKKKKRSTASQDSGSQQPADGEGTIVRKKKKRSGDANVVRQQEQQQEEEQQPRKKKKCKGEGCPDNN
jgi:Family of unknown function (DUF6600)